MIFFGGGSLGGVDFRTSLFLRLWCAVTVAIKMKDGLIEGDVLGPEEFECVGGGRLD